MSKLIINNIILFIALVVAQSVIFNNLVLFNSAVALVFLFMIIQLPVTVSTNATMTTAFLLGLSVDIFQDTPGLNAMACTLITFMRRPIFHLYVPRDEDLSGKRVCINTLGTDAYLKYMLTIVVLYCSIYFALEAINYRDIQRLLIRIAASSVFTFIVIYAIDSLTVTRREKRL